MFRWIVLVSVSLGLPAFALAVPVPKRPEAPPPDPAAIAQFEKLPANALRLGSLEFAHALGGKPHYPSDGQTLLSADWDSISEWDIDTRKLRRRYSVGDIGGYMKLTTTRDAKIILAVSMKGSIVAIDRFAKTIRYRIPDLNAKQELKPKNPGGEALVFEFRNEGESQYQCLELSPDGTRFAAGSFSGDIHFFNTTTGEREDRILSHPVVTESTFVDGREFQTRKLTPTTYLAWSPDGKQLASAAFGQGVRVWTVATGKLLWTPPENLTRDGAIVFLPDGEHLVLSTLDQPLGPMGRNGPCASAIWKVGSSEKPARRLEGRFGSTELQISRDGTLLAGGNNEFGVRVWDVATGKAKFTFPSCFGPCRMDFSRDGDQLAVGAQGLQVFDLKTGQDTRTLRGHTGRAIDASFSKDGERAATVSIDGTVIVWNVTRGEIIRKFAFVARLHAIALSPDGQQFTIGMNHEEVATYSVETGQRLWLAKDHGSLGNMAYSPDGQWLAVAGANFTLHVYHPQTGRSHAKLVGHFGPERTESWRFAWSPDSKSIAMPHCRVKPPEAPKAGDSPMDFPPEWPTQSRYDPKAGPNSKDDGVLRLAIWNVAGRKRTRVFDEATFEQNLGFQIAWSPDGKTIAFGEITTRLIDPESGKITKTLPTNPSRGLAFLKDRLLLGSEEWNPATQKLREILPQTVPFQVISAAEGRRVLSLCHDDSHAVIWNWK